MGAVGRIRRRHRGLGRQSGRARPLLGRQPDERQVAPATRPIRHSAAGLRGLTPVPAQPEPSGSAVAPGVPSSARPRVPISWQAAKITTRPVRDPGSGWFRYRSATSYSAPGSGSVSRTRGPGPARRGRSTRCRRSVLEQLVAARAATTMTRTVRITCMPGVSVVAVGAVTDTLRGESRAGREHPGDDDGDSAACPEGGRDRRRARPLRPARAWAAGRVVVSAALPGRARTTDERSDRGRAGTCRRVSRRRGVAARRSRPAVPRRVG